MSPTGLRRQIGQLLIAGFDGPALSVEIKSLAREFGLGGVILFARNLAEPEQVAELCFEAARLDPDLPVWVSIDQEGGRVARLQPPHWKKYPPGRAYGELPAETRREIARLGGRLMAHDLAALGINVDCVPVLDVPHPGAHDVIGDRAYADTPEGVASLGRASVQCLCQRFLRSWSWTESLSPCR